MDDEFKSFLTVAEKYGFGKQWKEMIEKKDYSSVKEAERAAERAESICRYLRVAVIRKAKERLEMNPEYWALKQILK